jgi:hypothetical protein
MAMIESFRKCYNKIQPFSLVDYFRGNGSEISVKYMAYMRVRFNNTSETSENFEKDLNTEIENINAGMISNKTFNSTVAYSDYKPADQTKANSLDEKTSDSKNQTINTDKEKSKNVKWTHIKS